MGEAGAGGTKGSEEGGIEMPTTLINLHGQQGLTDAAYSGTYVYIGRPSKWGNPFVIDRDGTREEVIAKYEGWVRSQPALMAAIPSEIKDHVCGCWCAPKPCHGDVLVKLADAEVQQT